MGFFRLAQGGPKNQRGCTGGCLVGIGLFAESYYPTLISIKLDLTTPSPGFKWSKSFFIWQSGSARYLLCYPIYSHQCTWRLGLWHLQSQMIYTNNKKMGTVAMEYRAHPPHSLSSCVVRFIYTLTLDLCTLSRENTVIFCWPRWGNAIAMEWAVWQDECVNSKRGSLFLV